MIKLTVTPTRDLIINTDEKVYKGDENISSFAVTLPQILNGERISEYEAVLRVYIPDEGYLSYTLDTSKTDNKVDIGFDITDKTQTIKLKVVFTKGGNIVGQTDEENFTIYDTSDEVEIESRAAIDAASAELESVLDGTYVEPVSENNGGNE